MQPPATKKPRSGAARGQAVRQPSSRSRQRGDGSASDEGEGRHGAVYGAMTLGCQCSSSDRVILNSCQPGVTFVESGPLMPNAAAELYDQDFLLWTREQSKLLREAAEHRVNFPLDWENLAEEIESLGKSLRSELRSRLRTIEHLLKLEHSAAREPRNGWIETVER